MYKSVGFGRSDPSSSSSRVDVEFIPSMRKSKVLPFGALDTHPMIFVTVDVLRTSLTNLFSESGTGSKKFLSPKNFEVFDVASLLGCS
jgi:hypothetical protein